MSADARIRGLLLRIQESGVTPHEACRDCPELLPEVRERLANLRAFESSVDAIFPVDADDYHADGPGGGAPVPEFPGYQVAGPLGSGGMGVVYKARELASGRVVALKVIHPHLRRLPGLVERLAREAEIGSQVVHDNVVRTLGLAPDAGRVISRQALVTEYVEGQTLRGLLREMGRVPEQLCRHVGREIARGLAAIHACGAVHRDLKPENVMITRDNVVKVMDLGVARLPDAAGDLTQSFVGSLRYAAPEQVRRGGAALDGRADLYALGLTLYELSTGRHAQDSGDAPFRRAGEMNPQLSALFEEVLAKLLAHDREKRFASATDVAEILELGEQSAWWRERSNAIRRATRNAPRRIRLPRETALHGREAELSLLRMGFACAANGDGRVILVQGEAGVGKSRLLDEFVAQLQPQDVHVLFGGYAPGGAATPSGAFAAAYREFLGDEAMSSALRGLLPQNAGLVAAFAALLRSEPPPGGSDALSKDALQTAFARTTQSLAADRPTVVVIEDLHLAPEEGRALFAALAFAVPGHRVLLVATARRTLDAKWAADLSRLSHASRVALRRLGRHELTSLLSDALRSTQAAEALAPRIDEKSDGNPYFVFELLRSLRESGLLVSSPDGSWTSTQTIRDIPSPSSITDLIAARVAELVPEEREILEVASCCGFEFDPLLVADVLGLARLAYLRRLGMLESAHRLVRSTGRLCAFDHHQIHEVVYAGLSQTHRESLHAAIAVALERASGAAGRSPEDLGGAVCVDLASHLLDGAAGDRVLRYLDGALDHLEESCRNEAAARLLERALATSGLLAGTSRCEHLLRLARSYQHAGNLPQEARVLLEANALADHLDAVELRAKARLESGRNHLCAARYGEALAALAEAADFHRQVGDLRGEGKAMSNTCSALTFVGRYDEALDLGRRAIELSRRSCDRSNEAWSIHHLGWLSLMRGQSREAGAQFERSAAIFRELGNKSAAGTDLGNVMWGLGRYPEALVQFEEHLACCREVGDRRREASACGSLSSVYRSVGRCAEAKANGERALMLARECGSRLDEALAAANHGTTLLTLGRNDEARRLLEMAVEAGREVGHRLIEVVAIGGLGEYFLNVGKPDEAREVLERQLELAVEMGDRGQQAAALACLGAAEVDAGRVDKAVRRLDAAIAVATDGGYEAALLFATAQRACLPGGDPGRVVALFDELGERADFSIAMCSRWFLWEATRAPEHLAEARRLLDFLVANAPPDCRTSMVENVRLARDIRAAAAAHPAR